MPLQSSCKTHSAQLRPFKKLVCRLCNFYFHVGLFVSHPKLSVMIALQSVQQHVAQITPFFMTSERHLIRQAAALRQGQTGQSYLSLSKGAFSNTETACQHLRTCAREHDLSV